MVRLEGGLRVDADPLRETHRDQRALQAVLERESHAEVRREAQRGDDLGGADLVLAGLQLRCHISTVLRGAPVTTPHARTPALRSRARESIRHTLVEG